MKKNNLILSILFIILIGILLVYSIYPKEKISSESFILNIYADFTSSGGTRHYNSTLNFENDKLVSGWELYETWPGNGEHNIIECIINNETLKWVDKNTLSDCKYDSNYIPLTKNEIFNKINSSELKTAQECGHLELCYEITYLNKTN